MIHLNLWINIQFKRSRDSRMMSHCIMGLYRPVLRCVTSLLGPLVIVYIMGAPGASKILVKFHC